jgi:adenylate cyclase
VPDAGARLREELARAGVADDEIERARAEGELGLLAVDRLLLPGQARYDRAELARRAGTDLATAVRLWRALAFADVPEGERAFTDDDLRALVMVGELVSEGFTDIEVAVQQTRVIGSSLARIAQSQLGVLEERIDAAGVTGDEAVVLALDVVQRYQPRWDALFAYVHRRHVQAAAKRASFVTGGGRGVNHLAVGFADLVGFTALSQQLDEHALAAVVDRFEAVAFDTVAELGGRVVKMIGDEVMFVSDDLACAATIGLTLAESYADDERLSDVRVGIASGPVVGHEGDYFGPVVNLASRIVNIAYAGSVVVSDEVYRALLDNPAFGWKPIRPRRLKGIGLTPLWAVTRPGQGSPLATEVARRVRDHRNRSRSDLQRG